MFLFFFLIFLENLKLKHFVIVKKPSAISIDIILPQASGQIGSVCSNHFENQIEWDGGLGEECPFVGFKISSRKEYPFQNKSFF